MPVKIARSNPSTIVRAARAAGSQPYLPRPGFQGRCKIATLHAGFGVIRGMSDESAGMVNGPGLRLRCADRTDGLRISSGAPMFDLRARSGVLAILRSINCPPGDGTDPSGT